MSIFGIVHFHTTTSISIYCRWCATVRRYNHAHTGTAPASCTTSTLQLRGGTRTTEAELPAGRCGTNRPGGSAYPLAVAPLMATSGRRSAASSSSASASSSSAASAASAAAAGIPAGPDFEFLNKARAAEREFSTVPAGKRAFRRQALPHGVTPQMAVHQRGGFGGLATRGGFGGVAAALTSGGIGWDEEPAADADDSAEDAATDDDECADEVATEGVSRQMEPASHGHGRSKRSSQGGAHRAGSKARAPGGGNHQIVDRMLRESATANRANPDEQLVALEAEAARRLQSGRESVLHAQEMAKEALLGFFPIAMTNWPSLEEHTASIHEALREQSDGKASQQPGSTPSDAAAAAPLPFVGRELPGSRAAQAAGSADGQPGSNAAGAAVESGSAAAAAAAAGAGAAAGSTPKGGVARTSDMPSDGPASGSSGGGAEAADAARDLDGTSSREDDAADSAGSHDAQGSSAAPSSPSSGPATCPSSEVEVSAVEIGEVGEVGEVGESDVDAQGLLQMQLLKSYFVSRNQKDFTTLGWLVHSAEATPNPIGPIAELLATGGVDVNDGGACGWSPLLLALLGGDSNLPTVRLLIQHKACLEHTPSSRKGQTALLLASANRQEACVRELVTSGASLSVADRDGKRPLIHCASWHPDAKAKRACKLLIESLADVTVRDSRGQLAAYTAALESGNAQTAQMLRDEAQRIQERAQLELLGDASEIASTATSEGGNSGPPGGKKSKKKSKGRS